MRKILNVTITDEGRDYGKVFVLTEMPAVQAEKWAVRALLAMVNSGAKIPDNIAQAGVAGLAALGISALANIPWAQAEPLIDELMTCVKFMPEPAKPSVVRALYDEDIEEVPTLIKLKAEVFKMHTSFLKAVDLVTVTPPAAQ